MINRAGGTLANLISAWANVLAGRRDFLSPDEADPQRGTRNREARKARLGTWSPPSEHKGDATGKEVACEITSRDTAPL